MSALDDPRVTEVDGGYRVVKESGSLMVFHSRHWAGDMWRAYFGTSTVEDRWPRHGLAGSASENVEETVEWALR